MAKNFLDNLISSAQNTFSNIGNSFAKSAQTFSQQPIRIRQQPTPAPTPIPVRAPQTFNLTSNPFNQSKQNFTSAINYFDATKDSDLKKPGLQNMWTSKLGLKLAQAQQPINDTLKELPISFKRAGGTAKIGTGVAIGEIQKLAKTPIIKDLSVSPLGGPKLSDISSPVYEKVGEDLIGSGMSDIKEAERRIQSELAPIEDKGSLLENIKNPDYVRRGLVMNVPSFLSSLGVGALTTAITKNPVLGFLSAFGPSFAQNTGDVYNDAKNMGASDQDAKDFATLAGIPMGLLDATGVSGILAKFAGKEAVDITAKALLKNLVKNSALEGGTESVQQIVQNTVARVYYDHARDLFAGVDESGFFGALMGGAGSVGTDVGMSAMNKYDSMPTEIKEGGYIAIPGGKDATQEAVGQDGIQIGITSAQAASPVTAQSLAEGTQLFESGDIDGGLAKLQEVTTSTQPEFAKILEDNGVDIIRLETGTHGLYFGTPEPSYWLQVDGKSEANVIRAVAEFAKNHNQESFITAKRRDISDNLAEITPGLTVNFGKALTNEQVVQIEKIANEQGIGLTLNQKTGEAVAYNVPQFDSMDSVAFINAATKTEEQLAAAGFSTTSRLDNYQTTVYNNTQYDSLIAKGTNQTVQPEKSTTGQISTGSEGQSSSSDPTQQSSAQEVNLQDSPTSDPLLPGQKERGLITSIKENETIPEEVRTGVSGNYDMTTDAGRERFGNDFVKNNFEEAQRRVFSQQPEPSDIIIGTALFKDAIKRGDTDFAIEVANAVAAKATPTAQNLQFLHTWSQSSPAGFEKYVQKIFDQANKEKNSMGNLGGRGLNYIFGKSNENYTVTAEMKTMITERMKKIYTLTGAKKDAAMLQLFRDTIGTIEPTFLRHTVAYRYQNMLSNPLTQLRNTYHNLKNAAFLRPLTILAQGDVKGTGVYYKHLFDAIGPATAEFQAALRGERAYGGGKWNEDANNDAMMRSVLQEKTPKWLRMAGDTMEASDLFFTELIGRAEKERLLYHGTEATAAEEQAYKTAAEYLYRKRLDPANTTQQGIMSSKIDEITQWIMKGRNVIPFGNWFIPFVQVPMSVAKRGLQYSPVGLVDMAGSNGSREVIAKAGIGSVLMIFGALAAAGDDSTWTIPTDKTERQLFYDSGRKPFSVRVSNNPALAWMENLPGAYKDSSDDVWIPMAYMGELGFAFAVPAALKHFSQDSKTALTENMLEKLGNATLGILNFWAQQTPLTGVGSLINTFSGNTDYTLAKDIGFTMGQAVPFSGLVKYITTIYDPIFRKTSGFVDQFVAGIPGLSKTLPAIETGTGQPAVRNLSNYLAPYNIGFSNKEPYDALIEGRQKELQLNTQANTIEKKVQESIDSTIGTAGSTSVTSTGTDQEKKLQKVKQNVNKLMESYATTDDPRIRGEIEKTIKENYGLDFETALQSYLLEDIVVKPQGLSEVATQKLERSNEFAYVRKLRDNYQGLGLGEDYLSSQLSKHNISEYELIYDDKTALPDDIQLEEIKSVVDGMSSEDLVKTLASFRKVSEGTRKPLLTDTLIGKLTKEGVIDDSTGDFLKTLVDDGKGGIMVGKGSGGSGKKPPAFKLSVPKVANVKMPKISVKSPMSGVKKIKSPYSKVRILKNANSGRLSLPRVTVAPFRISTRIKGLS